MEHRENRMVPLLKTQLSGFPGSPVVKTPPAKAGGRGSIPAPGRSHMPRDKWTVCRIYWSPSHTHSRAPQQEEPPLRGPSTTVNSNPRWPQLEKAHERSNETQCRQKQQTNKSKNKSRQLSAHLQRLPWEECSRSHPIPAPDRHLCSLQLECSFSSSTHPHPRIPYETSSNPTFSMIRAQTFYCIHYILITVDHFSATFKILILQW